MGGRFPSSLGCFPHGISCNRTGVCESRQDRSCIRSWPRRIALRLLLAAERGVGGICRRQYSGATAKGGRTRSDRGGLFEGRSGRTDLRSAREEQGDQAESATRGRKDEGGGLCD